MTEPKPKNAEQTEKVAETVQTAEPKPSKTVTGTIIRHGEDHYQFDPTNDLNYFVEIETKQGKYEMLWGVNLKGLVESQQLEVGEKASFHKFKREDGSKYAANQWEAERYFEEEKLENIIEPDFEQDKVQEKSAQTADQASEFGQSKVKQSADYGTDDAEYIVPNAIRNRYLSVAVNKHTDSPMVKFYERENPASVAFEDRGDKGLHTSKSDKDTVNAMLDMAQSKGWESIKLKGSAEFKREAWMEAQMRGIKTKGYEPSEKDKLELQARQAERTNNQIEATKISAVYTKEADKTSLDHAKDAGIAVGTSVAMGDNLTAATAVQAIVTDKVQSLAADVVIDQSATPAEQTEQSAAPAQTTDQAPEFGQSVDEADYRDDWHEAFAEADREAEIQAAEQHRDLKKVETEAYVRAEEFQRGRDIDPDLDMNVAGEAEQFKSNVVAAPKVAGMTQAKVTQKVEAAFDRKIDGSMAAAKREDFKKDFEENKAKLNDNDKVKVEAVRRILDYLHKDNPKELQAGYEKLTTAMKNGEISKLPDVPQQVVQQSIEIQAPTQSNKDRGR